MSARPEEVRARIHRRFGYYEYDPNGSEEWDREKAFESHLNNPRNFDFTSVLNAFQLRFKLDYLRKRIRDYNSRLDGARLFSGLRGESDRYLQVEGSLRPQNDEPPRYDMERAGEYLAWVTPEVERLESLARDLQQQLNVDKQEQIKFDNRVRWLTPGNWDMLAYMEKAHALRYNTPDHLLDGYWDFAQETERLKIAAAEQAKQTRRNSERLAALQSDLGEFMRRSLEIFQSSQPQRLEMRPAPAADIDDDDRVCVMEERDDWHQEEEEQPEPTHSEENRGNITQIPMIIPGNELLQLPLQPNHPINAPFQLSQLPFNGGSK